MFLVAFLVGLCMPMMAAEVSKEFTSSSVSIDSNFGNNATFITYKFADVTTPSNKSKYVTMSTSSSLTLSCTSSTYVIEAITITFYSSNNMGSANKNVTGTDGKGKNLGNKFTEERSTSSRTHKITFTNGAKNVVIKDDANSMYVTKIAVTYKKPGTITFDPNSYTLALNATQQLLPTSRTPSNATVTYTSSNTSVATVTTNSSRGTVTAKGVGTAIITAKTTSTSEYAAASADITITVPKQNPNLSISNTTASGTDRAASVTVDGQVNLVVSGTDGAISCTGYDSSVATVTVNNNNKTITVKGVIGGTTTIKVNTAETSNYNAAFKYVIITVNKKTDSSASLSPTSATLTVGESQQLTFSTVSDGSKSYSSDNESVATVSNTGLVTAVGAGTARITATAAESSKYEKVEREAEIRVYKTGSATLSAENSTLTINGTTQLTLSTTNTGASVTYSTSNDKVVSVSASGVVTAKGIGKATITADVDATSEYTKASATVDIEVTYLEGSYTFNVASISVEGMPQSARDNFWFISYNVSLKQSSLGEEGTKKLSLAMSKQNWSVIGLCEDYNYHNQLMTSLSGAYNSYTKDDSGISSASSRNSTDGLGLLVSKGYYTLGNLSGSARWSGGSGADILEHTANGNLDNLVYRGYRSWPVTLPNGAVVDVYVFHMDAGVANTSSDYLNGVDKNVIARRNQLTKLVNVVKTSAKTNKRPAIVMGVTNALYTSDELKTNLIDAVNKEADLTINDAWVELMRGGKYPTYGTDNETPGSLYFDDQHGEVVNKVFYINHASSDYKIKANSYHRNVENFAELDHEPVVVNFTVSSSSADEEEDVDEGGWVIPESDKPTVENPSMVLGEQVTSETTYFVKNVNSGCFLMAGADWGTRACEGSAAMPVKIVKQGTVGETYTLATLSNYVFVAENNAERVFMDGGDIDAGTNLWVLEKVANTETVVNGIKACQYYIYHTTYGALTSTGEGEYGNLVYCTPLDKNNDNQKWVLLTTTNMRNFMSSATVSNPFDITPFMIGGADFGRMLVEKSDAKAWSDKGLGFWTLFDGSQHSDGFAYRASYNYQSSTSAIVVSKTLSSMPIGVYYLSFEGFYHAKAKTSYTGHNADFAMNIPVTLGSNYVYLNQNNEAPWASADDDWGKGKLNELISLFRDGDTYKSEVKTTLSAQGDLKFEFNKPSFTDGEAYYLGSDQDFPRREFVAIDNFSIKYFGSNYDNSVKLLIYNYLIETAAKVALLNEAGQAAYNVSEVINRYYSGILSADGSIEMAMIDAAYEIALAAHNAKEAEDALEENNGDVTGLIVNPSFEQGTKGWTIGYGSDAGVKYNVDAYYVANAHSDVEGEAASEYQLYNGYNVWGWTYDTANKKDEWGMKDGALTMDNGAVKQTVTNLKNGLYELTALVTSFPDYTVYIFGNGSYAGVKAESKEQFKEVTLRFLVESGTAEIGAIGAFNGYHYTEGCFFKADNFRLKYICDAAHGRVKLALDEATRVQETLDQFGQSYVQLTNVLSQYKAKYDAGTIVKTDGTKEAAEIYEQLKLAALQQKTIGSDMTWCLGDPSFELGKYTTEWSRMSAWDAKAALQSDATYSAVGVEGSYLFNAWQPGTTTVPALTKTIEGLPNGTYRLSAMVTSDAGNTVYIIGNDQHAGVSVQDDIVKAGTKEDGSYIYWRHEAKKKMFPVQLEFEVTDGSATIGVVGGNYGVGKEGEAGYVAHGSFVSDVAKGGCWYKVDNFHLELILLADNDSQTDDSYSWNEVLYLDEDANYIPALPRTASANGNTYKYKKVHLKRNVAAGVWNTFVVPFDMDYKTDTSCPLYGWEVKELTHISFDENNGVVMSFADAQSIKAGVSYMIRKKEGEALTEIVAGDGIETIAVNTTFATNKGESTHPTAVKDGTTLTIQGVYTNGYIPAGGYFINNNKFYQAKYDNTNRLRGYRAYMMVTDPSGQARKLSFRIGEGTDIDNPNQEEVSIVAIYNLNGVRLDDMETGINILQMSDGTTLKVIIK